MNVSVKDFECVGFVGFYDSIFDASDNLYNLLYEDEEYTFGIPRNSLEENVDYRFDYDEYRKDICIGWVEVMNGYVKDVLGIDCEMEFTDLSRPRYYNYANDRLFCNFKCRNFKYVVNHRILPLMRKNREILSEIIKENHTSYDGFCSFMDNDFDGWYKYLADCRNYKDGQFFLYFSHIVTYIVAVTLAYDKKNVAREFVDRIVGEVCENYESVYEHLEYLLTEEELIAKYGKTA